VFWAAVPKAAVHEDGKFVLWKHEIRLAEYWLVAAPSGDSVPTEHFYQRHFRGLIFLAANP
jgi:hypothetical protein